MFEIDEVINKSLDDIDALIEDLNKSTGTLKGKEEVKKAMDLPPEEVSDDIPEEEPTEEPGTKGTPVEGEGEGEGEEDEEDMDDEEDIDKSLESTLKENENVRKALEVSEFLDELVKGLSAVLTRHTEGLEKSISSTQHSNELLAKSFQGIVKAQKAVLETTTSLSKSMEDISARIERLESQPMTKKSLTSANAIPIEKSFAASTGGKPEGSKLSKSEAVMKLTEAYESGKTEYRDDILALEGTGDFNALSSGARNLLGL